MEKSNLYSVSFSSDFGNLFYVNDILTFSPNADSDCAKWDFSLDFSYWEEDAFIFSPACLYNGNRFPKNGRGWYSPMYQNHEMGENSKEYINNIPALNVDGSGVVELTVGDMATPCVAVFFKCAKKAVFVFFEQTVKGKNIGAKIQKQKFTLQFPSDRQNQYRMLESDSEYSGECTIKNRGEELGAIVRLGEKVSSKIIINQFDCENLPCFFQYFFNNRKTLLDTVRAKTNYSNTLLSIMENHFNSDCWQGDYYSIGNAFQSGWYSGVMLAFALAKNGSDLSKERSRKTIDYLCSHVAPSGLFYGKVCEGIPQSDSKYSLTKKEYENMLNAHLIRRSGDALFFLLKYFSIDTPKESWVNIAKINADALVNIFNENGTFGQFVNIENGKMLFPLSSGGIMLVGALAKAYEYFKDEKYLQTAISAGEYYYQNFILNGYTNGSAGDALCAPDSESAYAFLESFVCLFEATNDDKWLSYARDCANLFSSWVMSYKYEWVTDCEFSKQNINTVGSVFANVQNKHSAPGICTSSGNAIYKLYKYTGEKKYLDLIKDIVYFIPQCVSTPDKPIYAFNYPHGDERGRLKYGCICERVNTSDWEGENWIGSVWNGSCWCEISLILTFAELMDKEEFK